MNRRAKACAFVELTHGRSRQQPVSRGVAAECVGLLRRDNRSAQRRLHRRHFDHRKTVRRDPGGAREQRAPAVDRRKGHGVAADAGDRVLALETVGIDIGQGDRQWRGCDTLGLDERQPRHAAAGEDDAVHADVALLDIGGIGRRVDDRPRRNRHRRGKCGRLEGERHRAGRNQLLHRPALTRRGGLVSRNDLADGERLPGADADAFREVPLGRRHADDCFAARQRHSVLCPRPPVRLSPERRKRARLRPSPGSAHRGRSRAAARRSARRPCRPGPVQRARPHCSARGRGVRHVRE